MTPFHALYSTHIVNRTGFTTKTSQGQGAVTLIQRAGVN